MAPDHKISADFAGIIAAMSQLPAARDRSLDELRHGWDRSAFGPAEPVYSVRDLNVPVSDTWVGARIYQPAKYAPALLVYYHGGGWVMGGLDTHDIALRVLANRAQLAILAVDYRLAPEHPWPTPFDDACAALNWAAVRLDELIGNPGAKLIVGGDSAGGNLAAAVALASRVQNRSLAGQLLIYPSLDATCSSASFASHADCPLLTAADMRWYWKQYAAGQPVAGDACFSPTAATNLAGSPPAIVAVAGIDPLRDEALDYGVALARHDVSVRLLHYPDLPHGFFNFHPLAPSADRAMDEIAAQLQSLAKGADN